MSINGIEAVAPGAAFGTAAASGTAPTGTAATSGAAANTEDQDLFLELLVAQMKYQDPMNPTDSTQFLTQTAQFTMVEKLGEVADQTALLLSITTSFGAAGMVGRTVTYTGPEGAPVSGVVDGVTYSSDGPMLDVGGTAVPIGAVLKVTNGAAPAEPGTTTPENPGAGSAAV